MNGKKGKNEEKKTKNTLFTNSYDLNTKATTVWGPYIHQTLMTSTIQQSYRRECAYVYID